MPSGSLTTKLEAVEAWLKGSDSRSQKEVAASYSIFCADPEAVGKGILRW